MRYLVVVFVLLYNSAVAQIDLRQLIPDSMQYMIPITDSLLESEYYQKYHKLAFPHLFLDMDDSICFVLYEGADTFCVAVPEGTGVTDSTYQWILTTNGGAPDTITVNEAVNLVDLNNITITQGATDVTFDVPNMRDTCRHTLTPLSDTTFQLTDCLGADRGTVTIPNNACIQSMLVSNGVPDTVFITYCDGTTPKDTLLIWPAAFNDSYVDSAGVWRNDSIPFYRVDTSGIVDSFWIVVPSDSIDTNTDTDSQNIFYDKYLADIWLSRSADTITLVLPWVARIDTSYNAPYNTDIWHRGSANIGAFDNENAGGTLRVNGSYSLATVATFDNRSGNGSTIDIENDKFRWRLGEVVNGTSFKIIDATVLPAVNTVIIDTSVNSNALYLHDTIVQFPMYPEDRIDLDSFQQIKSVWGPIDNSGTMHTIPIDSLAKKMKTPDYDFVKLHGDTSYYGVAMPYRDTLLPNYEADLSETIWRPGQVRLGDTTMYKQTYDTLSFPYNTLTNESTKAALEIADKQNATHFSGFSYLYDWRSITKGDWSFRLHNQDVTADTLPHYYEIGVNSSYKAEGEELFDTTYRQVFRINSQANENAFILMQDSIILSDYTSDPSDLDTLMSVLDIKSIFVPKANGTLALVSLDSINAALSVAAGSPDLLYWDFKGDSLGILWSGLADTGFVDLSKYAVNIVGDSIYQGDTVFALPQGADSLGSVFTSGEVIIGTGDRSGTSYPAFTYTDGVFSGTSIVEVDGIIHAGKSVGYSRLSLTSLEIGENRLSNAASSVQFTSVASSISANATIQRNAGINGTFDIINTGTGAINLSTNGTTRLSIADGGQLTASGYTTGTSFAGTDVGVMGYSSTGLLQGMNAADLTSFLGINIPDPDSTSIAATQVAHSNGTSLVGEPAFTYDASTDRLTTKSYTATQDFTSTSINSSGGFRLQGSGNPAMNWWTNDANIYTDMEGADVSWFWRNIANSTLFTFNFSNGNFTNTGSITAGNYSFTPTGLVGKTSVGTLGLMNTGVGLSISSGTLNVSDQSASNELQNLSYTAGTRAVGISSGTGFTFPLFTASDAGLVSGSGGGTSNFLRADGTWATPPTGGGGIYGSSGNIGGGTGSVTASVGTPYNFNIQHEALGKLSIGTSGVYLRNISGGTVFVGETGNEWRLYDVSDTEARMRQVDAPSSSYIWSSQGGNIGIQSAASTQVVGSGVSISATGTSLDFLANTSSTITANTFITLEAGASGIDIGSSGTTRINDDVTIQGATGIKISNGTIQDLTGSLVLYAPTSLTMTAAGGNASVSASNNVVLQSTGAGYVNSNSSLGVKRAPATNDLEVNGNAASKGTAGSWIANSDARLKKDIKQLDGKTELDKILKLRGVNFEWNDTVTTYERPTGAQIGLIAQDIQKAYNTPQFVNQDKSGYLQAAYEPYDAIFIEVIRYLNNEKEQMQRTIDDLRDVVRSHEDRLLKLEKMINK